MEFNRRSIESLNNSKDGEDVNNEELAKKYSAISIMLKSVVFKTNVIKECVELFVMKTTEFNDKPDEGKHLLGFINGVYDLDAKEFRAGRPDDFITYNTNINYDPNSNNDKRDFIRKLLLAIYNTEEMVKYQLEIFAYCLHGDKYLEIIHL
jgi:phage/plasmid-associated DNA primase